MLHNKFNFDFQLVLPVVILVFFGFLMVVSASLNISDVEFHSVYHFALRHGIMIILSMCCFYCVMHISINSWRKLSPFMLIVGLVLLSAVAIPGIGHQVNGSRRWLMLAGFTFQASEFMKCAMILFVSDFLVRRENILCKTLAPLLKLFILLIIVAALLLMEPDFGALTVIVAIVMSLTFLAGIPLRYFIYLALGAFVSLGIIAISAPYRMLRLTSFLNPWAHPFSSGYQLTQSLIAFGRGGITGVGLGDSLQKLFYLPEAHTDFLFAVIGEELGLLGCVCVLLLLSFVVLRGMKIARDAMARQDRFAGYIGYGVSIWIAIQSAINIGVNAGVLPTKGLTLPLISYGGTSIVMTGVALGWLFRIYHENALWQKDNFSYQLG